VSLKKKAGRYRSLRELDDSKRTATTGKNVPVPEYLAREKGGEQQLVV